MSAKKMKVADLKEALKAKGLDTSGLKADLVARLEAAEAAEATEPAAAAAAAAAEPAPVADADVADATAAATPAPDATPDATAAPAATATPAATEEDSAQSVIDARKRRAERFGVPLNLTEKDKKALRAAKFGTGSTSAADTALSAQPKTKKQKTEPKAQSRFSEEEIAAMKKRAERFGKEFVMPTVADAKPAGKGGRGAGKKKAGKGSAKNGKAAGSGKNGKAGQAKKAVSAEMQALLDKRAARFATK